MIAIALVAGWLVAQAASPAPTAQAPQPAPTGVPATPARASQPARPRAAAPASPAPTTSLAVTVTDLEGAVLGDVLVSLVGATEREARTSETGFARLQTIPAGTWRVRFSRDGFHTFEKELVWRAGQPAPTMLVTLSPAPPPPPPPAAAPAAPVGAGAAAPGRTESDGAARLHREELHQRP